MRVTGLSGAGENRVRDISVDRNVARTGQLDREASSYRDSEVFASIDEQSSDFGDGVHIGQEDCDVRRGVEGVSSTAT